MAQTRRTPAERPMTDWYPSSGQQLPGSALAAHAPRRPPGIGEGDGTADAGTGTVVSTCPFVASTNTTACVETGPSRPAAHAGPDATGGPHALVGSTSRLDETTTIQTSRPLPMLLVAGPLTRASTDSVTWPWNTGSSADCACIRLTAQPATPEDVQPRSAAPRSISQ